MQLSPPDKNGAADLENHVPELRLLSVRAHQGEEINESKQRDYHGESLCTRVQSSEAMFGWNNDERLPLQLLGGVGRGLALFGSVIWREQSKQTDFQYLFDNFLSVLWAMMIVLYIPPLSTLRKMNWRQEEIWLVFCKRRSLCSGPQGMDKTNWNRKYFLKVPDRHLPRSYPKSDPLSPSSPGFNILRVHHITIFNNGNPVRR